MKNKVNEIITYDKFIAVPIFMYKTTGIIFDSTGRKSFWMTLIFLADFTNLLALLAAGTAFFYRTFGNYSNFLQATAIGTCLCVGLMCLFKAYLTLQKTDRILNILNRLREIFPKTKQDQEAFNVEICRKRMITIMAYYMGIWFSLIGAFDACATFQSTVEMMVYNQTFVRRLPYLTWYPFDMSNLLVYSIIYLHQSYAAYIVVAITVGSDTLMCCIVMQLVMHFNFLSNELRKYCPGRNALHDYAFLRKFIQRHEYVLSICDDSNNLFSILILLNFLVSSLLICLVGFQATTGANSWDLFTYIIFFLTAMTQVFLICYFGNMLMDASYAVAEGAYNQNWIDANQEYKKMLLIVIMRAQNVASLKVITFDKVSLRSFKEVCSMAYQFFTLLRTFYGK